MSSMSAWVLSSFPPIPFTRRGLSSAVIIQDLLTFVFVHTWALLIFFTRKLPIKWSLNLNFASFAHKDETFSSVTKFQYILHKNAKNNNNIIKHVALTKAMKLFAIFEFIFISSQHLLACFSYIISRVGVLISTLLVRAIISNWLENKRNM